MTKLGPAGGIVYSTYLSGHHRDLGMDLAVDGSGSAHVVGITASTNFPVANARQPFLRGFNDAFVAKLHPSGSSLLYSTYLGGNDREEGLLDLALSMDVALDSSGNAYVAGFTQSIDFPAVFPVQAFGGGLCLAIPILELRPCPDAFVSKLDSQGALLFSSPIGGSGDDRGRGVAVAHDGTVYVVGTTSSADFPVKAPLQPTLAGSSDVFVTKVTTAPPACQLPAPVQLSPGGGIFDDRPTFSWAAVAGAEAYFVLASNLAHFLLTGTPPVQLLGITTGTSVTPAAALAAGDYLWTVLPWNAACGLGELSRGMAFTLPGACPAPTATQISPVGGAVVNNPTRFEWTTNGPSRATLFVVVIRPNGQFVAQYATANTSFTMPDTLSTGDYVWLVLTWNSTCGTTVSGPAFFRSTGGVEP